MNRLDQADKLLKEQLREIEAERRLLDKAQARIEKARAALGASILSNGTGGRGSAPQRIGFKIGVSRDVVEFFKMQPEDTWLTLDQVVAGLASVGSDWSKEIVRPALNKGVTRYGTLLRQGDKGSYRYALNDEYSHKFR